MRALVVAVLLLTACGDPGVPAADGGEQTLQLRTAPYALAAGGEDYRCTWFAPGEASGEAIRTMRPVSGPGVHHTALFFAVGDSVQAERSCTDFGRNWVLVAGAGVGSDQVVLPDGVALPVRTDGAYVLQVHMLNATAGSIDVQAGYDLGLTAPGANWQRAGVYITGKTSFTIPAGAMGYQAQAACSGDLLADARLISLFPHMHKLGSHFHVDLTRGGASSVLYDGGWAFESQAVVPIAPEVPLAIDDQLTVRCTWDNPGTSAVRFGEHTSDEMCFGVFYYYPATTDEVSCVR
jgi:hypothetical protein